MTKQEFIQITEDVKKIDVLDFGKSKIRTIKTSEEINNINVLLSNIHEISGQIELESNTWFLLMYNENSELICYMTIWRRGYVGFGEKINKEYQLDSEDIISLVELLEK
jgi:hypothetical protein